MMNPFNSQHEADALHFYCSLTEPEMYRLSRNFTLAEFRSNDHADLVLVHPSLIIALQALRDHTQRPVRINSAYRSPAHNKAIGGASASYHTKGMAADITIDGMTPLEVASLAHDLGLGGIKAYPSFTHIDVGPRRTW